LHRTFGKPTYSNGSLCGTFTLRITRSKHTTFNRIYEKIDILTTTFQTLLKLAHQLLDEN